MIRINLEILDYVKLVKYIKKELFEGENLESIVSLSISEVQKDEILDLLVDKLLEIRISDYTVNSEGLIIERLIDTSSS